MRFRFTIRDLLWLVTGVTVVAVLLVWHFTVTRDRQRLIYDQVVATALTTIHWQSLEEATYRSYTRSMSNSFNSQSACGITFLLPDGKFKDGTPVDDFERQILADWSKAPILADMPPPETATRGSLMGTFTYYKAIRAESKGCITCHDQSFSGGAPMKLGDIIAIAKVDQVDLTD